MHDSHRIGVYGAPLPADNLTPQHQKSLEAAWIAATTQLRGSDLHITAAWRCGPGYVTRTIILISLIAGVTFGVYGLGTIIEATLEMVLGVFLKIQR